MKVTNKIFNRLIGFKNKQLSLEREKNRALGETNTILSAYIAILIGSRGDARIPRKMVRDSIGRYSAKVCADGDDYIISVVSGDGTSRCGDRDREAGNGGN